MSCAGGGIESHLLGTTLRWISVLSRGVVDFPPLNTTETGDKRRPYEPLGSGKDLVFNNNKQVYLRARERNL